MPLPLADVPDPLSGIHVSWMLWIVPTLAGAAVAWYLVWVRHRAYDPRTYLAGAAVAAVIAIGSLAKFLHEADKALSSFPGGATTFVALVIALALYAYSQQLSGRRW